MKEILQTVTIVIALCAGLYGCVAAVDSGWARQEQYAQANNCRYEGGLCYTYKQRGYLWPETCSMDAQCRQQWGL